MANSEQSRNSRTKSKTRESARAVSVVDRLVSALGRDIAGGVWKPGATLPTEPEIAHRLGAGRNAVREAVKILAAKGFVRTERRAGTIVRPEFCWSAARHAQRRRFMTGLCLGERLADPVSSWAVSVQITERYIGCKQPLRAAVNDKLGIEPK